MPALDQIHVRQFSRLELFARQVVEGFLTGLHKSPYHGFSVEFAEHRQYNTGESVRHVDWKLFGRSDKLFVKRYEEETNLRCQLVIDVSASMFFPAPKLVARPDGNKLGFAVHAAAALIYLLRKQRDAVGLTLFDSSVRQHLPARGAPSHVQQVFAKLESLIQSEPAQGNTAAAQVLDDLAERIPRRSLMVIFSDLFDANEDTGALFNALQHLKHAQHEVIFFHVLDKQYEEMLNFEDRPYTFVDAESGQKVKLNPIEIRQHYREQVAELRKSVALNLSTRCY
jgi:uncharacterized protein (DUF58 family)